MAADHVLALEIPLFRSVATEEEGGGAYLNEANVDYEEGRWQGEFYGAENYKRLLGVKAKWDPGHVFYATTGVGSEGWVVQGGDKGGSEESGWEGYLIFNTIHATKLAVVVDA
ncbi:hypothetical protein B0T16DRAFT_462125 [Cercophora newfieldiana]|uniref:Berberine/berberine-like domain-containing protein n=1 Tax=Cercophora newfieldiana TaxID=92897 RepID=A0AA39XXW1_9PEZI|nr:hypothetical protein B0T16DRAFT_462125 [Cercophora newfieldiana]